MRFIYRAGIIDDPSFFFWKKNVPPIHNSNFKDECRQLKEFEF